MNQKICSSKIKDDREFGAAKQTVLFSQSELRKYYSALKTRRVAGERVSDSQSELSKYYSARKTRREVAVKGFWTAIHPSSFSQSERHELQSAAKQKQINKQTKLQN